jgi:WD40 repeat protein
MIEESESDEYKDHFKKNNRIREYSVHSSKIHTVAWNCEGRRLASGSFDKTVAMFTLDKDKLVGWIFSFVICYFLIVFLLHYLL